MCLPNMFPLSYKPQYSRGDAWLELGKALTTRFCKGQLSLVNPAKLAPTSGPAYKEYTQELFEDDGLDCAVT